MNSNLGDFISQWRWIGMFYQSKTNFEPLALPQWHWLEKKWSTLHKGFKLNPCSLQIVIGQALCSDVTLHWFPQTLHWFPQTLHWSPLLNGNEQKAGRLSWQLGKAELFPVRQKPIYLYFPKVYFLKVYFHEQKLPSTEMNRKLATCQG